MLDACKTLAPKDRDPFLRALAAELEKRLRDIGPGLVHRLVRETQRQFSEPPNLSSLSKYD